MSNTAAADALLVRRALPQDAGALVALCAAHAQFEGAAYSSAGKHQALMRALEASTPRVWIWVAQTSGAPLGYASASCEFSTWQMREFLHLDCLFVVQDARSAGIGAALLAAVMAQARVLGVDELQWQTPAWNDAAARFYRRSGALAQPKLRFSLALRDASPAVP